MKDIESQSMQNTMSLRKRKNLQSMSGPSNLTSSEKELLRKHSTLMKQINSAKDDDDLNEDDRFVYDLQHAYMYIYKYLMVVNNFGRDVTKH